MIVNDINDDINKTFNKNWQIFASGICFLEICSTLQDSTIYIADYQNHRVMKWKEGDQLWLPQKSTNQQIQPINPPCPRLAVWLGRSRRTWCGCRPSPGEGWPWRRLRVGWVMGAPWILDEAGWTCQQDSACGCCSSS